MFNAAVNIDQPKNVMNDFKINSQIDKKNIMHFLSILDNFQAIQK